MSLAFLPRKVGRRNTTKPTETAISLNDAADISGGSKSKGKSKESTRHDSITSEETVLLVQLSTSNYTLWNNDNVRNLVLASQDGFFPLSALLQCAVYFLALDEKKRPSQALLMQAIKTHVAGANVRMCLVDPLSSSELEDPGGYEVRCDTWRLAASRNWDAKYWDERTLYMENIPHSHRSIVAIHRFLVGLYSCLDCEALDIQSITFPPHHAALENEIPRNKGFAFVVFSSSLNVEKFHHAWPWDVSNERTQRMSGGASETPFQKEAVIHGFRTMPKVRWNALRDEYLAYRERLLDDARNCAVDTPHPNLDAKVKSVPTEPTYETITPVATPDPWFPRDCVVFAKKLHVETNKTTLRKLFERAFSTQGFEGASCIDYIDYQKGLNSCYIRVTIPVAAQRLCEYFSNNLLVQQSGLDDSGAPTIARDEAIQMEALSGAREEIYWEKIPEKVRLVAMHRSLACGDSVGSGNSVQHKRRRLA